MRPVSAAHTAPLNSDKVSTNTANKQTERYAKEHFCAHKGRRWRKNAYFYAVEFVISQAAVAHLTQVDAALGAFIAHCGALHRAVCPDVYTALVWAVTGQQVSLAAQATIFARLKEQGARNKEHQATSTGISPHWVVSVGIEGLRACGLSGRKAEYILGATEECLDGRLDLEGLAHVPDDDARQRLSQLRGFGQWSANMVLLFGLQRADVLATDDLGIRRGLCRLHHLEALSNEQAEHFRQLYSPYGSTASLYLWEIRD